MEEYILSNTYSVIKRMKPVGAQVRQKNVSSLCQRMSSRPAIIIISYNVDVLLAIQPSDNDSTGFWPPGLLHTLGADGHIKQRDWLFMWIQFFCIDYILWAC